MVSSCSSCISLLIWFLLLLDERLVVVFLVLRQRPLLLGLHPCFLAVKLLELARHLPVEEIQGDVHGTGAFAFGAAGASSGQMHGADDVPPHVAGRSRGGLDPLGPV